jgi:hypothetical protein
MNYLKQRPLKSFFLERRIILSAVVHRYSDFPKSCPMEEYGRPWRKSSLHRISKSWDALSNLENHAVSSLHRLLLNRLVGKGGGLANPSPFTHSLAGSVKTNTKTTAYCPPDSSMAVCIRWWMLGVGRK